jgi:hypothetical protein
MAFPPTSDFLASFALPSLELPTTEISPLSNGRSKPTRHGPSARRPPSVAVARALQRFYAAAREHFGYTSVWWPGTPIELTVTLPPGCGAKAARRSKTCYSRSRRIAFADS